MSSLPTDGVTFVLLVFGLGLKHGFDADHLATIDGLTRFNVIARPRLARYCGTLFSLGHGAVVLAAALGVSLLAGQWRTPEWLLLSGAGISLVFLILVGVLNLRAALTTDAAELVHPVGFKGRWLGRCGRIADPRGVALVGALFALSFDTLSQAALLGVASGQAGAWAPALGLGLCFTFGMMAADGLNGWWVAHLIARADEVARVASRVMALAVGGMSLLVAAYGCARLALPEVDAWSEGRELLFGGALIAVLGASFLLAVRLARGGLRHGVASSPAP